MYETQEAKITLIKKEFPSVWKHDEPLRKHSELLLAQVELFQDIERKKIYLSTSPWCTFFSLKKMY